MEKKSRSRFFWKLGAVPYRDDPDGIGFGSVKKSVWRDDYLPEEKLRELRYDPPGLGEILQPSQHLLGSIAKIDRR